MTDPVFDPPTAKLTMKQSAFVRELIRCNDQVKAAMLAGCSRKSAHAQAYKWLQNPNVKRELGKARKRLWDQCEKDLGVVVEKLFNAITVQGTDLIDEKTGLLKPIHEMPERANSSIEAVEVTETKNELMGTTTIKTKLKLIAKSAAMDMVLKMRGMYAPTKVEQTTKLSLDVDTLYRESTEVDPIEQQIIEVEREGADDV